MAHCPNCGRKLHLYDWKPDCPGCGVNMVYFKSNERLLAESEAAEIAHAKSQPSIDRAKASFFGNGYAIARIVLSLLPIGALFLPVFKTATGSLNVIGIYKAVNEIGFGNVFGNAFGDLQCLSYALLLISVVMILVCLGCTVMSLGKHGKLRNLLLNCFLTALPVGSGICMAISEKGTPSVGLFLYVGLMLALTVYNVILIDKKLLKLKKTLCLIGGLPSDEYFAYVEQGMSDLEIRKKMVAALQKMQDEVREAAAKAEEKAMEERAHRK